jgi:hypothetical protein
MEEHRRTEAGRVRTAKEYVAQFFPVDTNGGRKDLLFHHVPQDVRGPVLSGWGIRGAKAALRDDDEKVKLVVADALDAGDIDEQIFEDGVNAQILVDWIPLADWWAFWRQGKLTGVAIQKALATARELALIDDKWFLLNVQGRGGKLKGTDVLCDTLSKDQIVAWIRKVHETGDGSPAGIIAAIGWETVLAKTAQDALLFALDQFAKKAQLVAEPPVSETSKAGDPVTKNNLEKVPEARPTLAADGPPPELVAEMRDRRDSGLPVAIPDIPAIDADAPESSPGVAAPVIPAVDEPPSIPSVQERSMWQGNEESPKLAEARAAMMKMLKDQPAGVKIDREPWDESEVPAKPSSLEWPEPPPLVKVPEIIEEPKPAPAAGAPAPPPAPKRGPAPVAKKN